MNLYQHNVELHPANIKKARWELNQFRDYLSEAKALIASQTLNFKVKFVKTILSEEGESPQYVYQVLYKGLPKKEVESLEKTLFGSVKLPAFSDIPPNENAKGKFKKLEVVDYDPGEGTLTFAIKLDEKESTLYFRPNIYQLEKQIQAIKELKNQPKDFHRPLLKLFSNQWDAFPSFDVEPIDDWRVLTDLERDGTSEQRDFVKKALPTPDFALLEGPPGSGKTTTIIELVIQLAMRGKRVLFCSATHIAIDNVIGRILTRYHEVCQEWIVPVRIASNESDVREDVVKDYRLQKLVKKKKDETKDFLGKLENPSPSQQYLLKNIDSQGGHFERVILDSANLVAGTTIGILQHPHLRLGKTSMEPFDYLIIDEASKVPFQEFLVPALHAKKWILVGDIQQLSPYVEDSYVSHALRALIPEEEQSFYFEAFDVKKRLKRKWEGEVPVMLVPANKDPEDYRNCFDSQSYVIKTIQKGHSLDITCSLTCHAADLIIAPDTYKIREWLSHHLTFKATLFCEEGKPDWKSRIQNHLHKNQRKKQGHKKVSIRSFTRNWDKARGEDTRYPDLVASKLNQKFGRRADEKQLDYVQEELDLLIPDGDAWSKVQRIERVVFPSILEMLQRGVGKSPKDTMGGDQHIPFCDGLPDHSQAPRFTSLTYQHRMHEDIAETSRQHFYNGNLKPANSVAEDRPDREWTYEPAKRVQWIAHRFSKDENAIQNKIIHSREVSDIEKELRKFKSFADKTPLPIAWSRASGMYEVAVLTFYRDQEAALRKMLRKLCGQHRKNRNFRLGNRIKLTLCTVDQFQGQEADMVLLSFTKYTRGAHYHSPNRLNVALTRARHKLVLFGDAGWMKDHAGLKALNQLGELPTKTTY
ncbi:MAG: DEAD/DEAH box helicase [Bacteroidota bacterium]